MSIDDRSWYTDRRHRATDDNSIVWKIALGVALGILIAGAVTFAVDRRLTHQALAQAAQQFERGMAKVRRDSQRAAQQNAARVAADAKKRQRADAQRRQALAEHQRADAAAKQRAIDEATRREQAWARYYRKPVRCEEPPDGKSLVQCANEFIRAKRSFDEKYSRGEL